MRLKSKLQKNLKKWKNSFFIIGKFRRLVLLTTAPFRILTHFMRNFVSCFYFYYHEMGEPNFCVATANSEFIPAKFGLSSKTVSSRYLLRLSVI